MTRPARVGILTAGGLAPCLSSAVGGLIERYTAIAPEIEIFCYVNGYAGLLTGDRLAVTPHVRAVSAMMLSGTIPTATSRMRRVRRR